MKHGYPLRDDFDVALSGTQARVNRDVLHQYESLSKNTKYKVNEYIYVNMTLIPKLIEKS